MQHATRLTEREDHLALLLVPVLIEEFCVLGLEASKPPIFFERDLQLGEVEIPGVPEAVQEEPVHDLGQRLVACADATVGGHVEDHGVRGDALVDLLEHNLQSLIASTFGQTDRGRFPDHQVIGERKSQELGKGRFARAEESRDPNRDSFMRLVRGGEVTLTDAGEVRTDRAGDDVLV